MPLFGKKQIVRNVNQGAMTNKDLRKTKELITDPVGFLTGKVISFTGISGERVNLGEKGTDLRTMTANGPTAVSKKFPSGISFDVVYERGDTSLAGAGRLTLNRNPDGVETQCRALPWEPDFCYFMQLDDAAKFWITGPLTGCHIYISGTATNPWVFHANSNSHDNNLALNMYAKRAMGLNILVSGIDAQAGVLSGRLERDMYSTKGYAGFVFGYRPGKSWKFYAYLHHTATNTAIIRPMLY